MAKKSLVVFAVSASILAAGIAYANLANPRQDEISVFHAGHSHDGSQTTGAPQHSGGTDKYGCHNASVPYHCH